MSSNLDDPEARPETRWVWDAERDWYMDEIETEWLTPAEFANDDRFGGRDRTTLQKAVALNACGLKQSRRSYFRMGPGPHGRGQRRYQGYRYAFWRMAEYFALPDRAGPPSMDEVRRLRTETDLTASQLARQIGFSAREVQQAAAAGDLKATLDPGTGQILFLSPDQAQQWAERDMWGSIAC